MLSRAKNYPLAENNCGSPAGACPRKELVNMITNTMSALMTAGTTLKQAQVQQSAVRKDEGHAGVLKAEIQNSVKTDTSAKEAELKETENHAAELKSKQSEMLANTNDELKKNVDRAEIADREEEKEAAKTTDKKAADKTDKIEKTDNFGNAPKTDEKESADAEKTGETAETAMQAVIPDPIRAPKPMDIKA